MIEHKNNAKYQRFKSILISTIVVLILSNLIFANISTQVHSSADDTSQYLEYSISFSEPQLTTNIFDREQYSSISIPGTYATGQKSGDPAIPAKPIRILLPQGTSFKDISISFTEKRNIHTQEKGINLKEIPIVPFQKQIPIGSEPPEMLDFNQHTYNYKTSVPEKLYDHVRIGYCRGYTILSLTLYPVDYNPSEGLLFYYPVMNIHVDLDASDMINTLYRGLPDDETWVNSLVMNPEISESYEEPLSFNERYDGGLCNPSDNNGQGYDYIVITTDALYDFTETYNWDDLLNKKESEGLEATKVKVEDIVSCNDYWNTANSLFNDTAALIREFCTDAYQDWETQYILIGGDDNGVNKIERREMDSAAESNVETDIYWTHLDNSFNADEDSDWGEEEDGGFDFYSEMYSGSIPCDEGIDVSNWLTKSFYYADSIEKDYLDNAAFYGGDTTWDCQGDTVIEFSAIFGTDDWMGPNPEGDGPYPSWLGFQYGFETWNMLNPGLDYNLSVKWTGEPPNPGWSGGSTSAAINGLRNAINNDACTLISAVAHANSGMSMDVSSSTWESSYYNTKPFFLTDQGCHCGDMDASDDGVLHSMLFHSDTELAFACVYNTGYGWGNYDGTNASSAVQMKSFWDYMFDVTNNSQSPDNWQLGKAQEWARDLMAPAIDWNPDGDDGAYRNTIQSCLLFGDPAQKIKIPFVPEHDILVTSIDIPSVVPHGEEQTVSAAIRNIGQNNETNIIVDFLVNETLVDTTTILTLTSMESQIVHFPWNPDIGSYFVEVESQPIPDEYDLINNNVNKTVAVIAAPAIEVTPLSLSFMMPTDAMDSDAISIANLVSAEAPLDYTISYAGDLGGSWLSALPASGSVAVDDADVVTVTVDSTGLNEGDYTGYVLIESNDVNDPLVVVMVNITVVFGNDMAALSINSPVGVIPAGSYTINATVQNKGYYAQNDVLVNCSVFEGGIGGTILDEDFSSDPTDWTITNIEGTAWTWDSGDERMENSYSGSPSGYLDSPVLDCSGKSGISLSFWHYWKADYSSGNQDGYVRGSVDGGLSFPFLIDEFHHNDPADETAVKSYDISSWANNQPQVMIRFDITNDNDWYWYVDDFNVSAEITGPLVYASESLVDIAAYEASFVEFTPAWVVSGGMYGIQITTLLAGDEYPGNDIVADVVSIDGPGLSFDPTSYDASNIPVNSSDGTLFAIWNGGVGLLTYDLSESCDWVEVSPLSGDSTGEHDVITVDIDTSDLAAGPYHCDISISSNGGAGVFSVDMYVISDDVPVEDVNQSAFDRGFPVRHTWDGDWGAAQNFTPSMGVISQVGIYLRKFGTPEFDLTVELRENGPEGTLLDSVVFPAAEVPSSWTWLTVDFSDTPVTPDMDYFIVLPPAPSGVSTSFGYEWGYAFGDHYQPGSFWFTRDGGGLWRDLPTMYEFTFRTFGLE